MAFCGDYKDMKVRLPKGASDIKDDALITAVAMHSLPNFYDQYLRDSPARYAYVRRWGSVLRREARRRGLL